MIKDTDWLIYDDMTDEQARELFAELSKLFKSESNGKLWTKPIVAEKVYLDD